MELKLNNGKGILEVIGINFEFLYSKTGDKIKIVLQEELKNPLLQIVTLEKTLRDLDYREIEIEILKKYKKLLEFLLDSTYLLKEGNRNTLIFSKSLVQKKSIRLSLTENCNYRCFFCHEEGMDMSTKREKSNFEEMCKLLLKMKQLNYQDLTFTGGEPLVAKKELIGYMRFMEKHDYQPDLTIVTNGYLIDEELIEEIKKYKGNFKFNFSMHCIDKENYLRVTNPKNNDKNALDKVLKNIELIKKNNIKLKMNFVLLKGINNSPEYIKKILDFAHKNGAYCVKFLELLVTNKLNKFFDYFFSLEAAIKSLKEDIFLENLTYRRKEYIYKDSLIVEFQKCTCANGCSVCPLNREINITPQMSYYPCFILDNTKIDIDNNNVESSLKKGDNIIENLIIKYGNKSPIIIKNIDNQKEKVEFYYKSSLSLDEIEKIMKKNNFILDRQRAFIDYIYGAQEDKSIFTNLLKLSKNNYDNHYREIVQYRKYDQINNKCNIEFITDGKIIEDKEEYERYLEHLGLKNRFIIEWNIKFYKKNNTFISIGINKNKENVYVVSEKKLDRELMDIFKLSILDEDIYTDILE